MTFPDDYRALFQDAVLGEASPRGQIAVAGKDRATYLQGLLTNDITALTAGTGLYSAWLTPQGRMLTDLHVFESGDLILLDLPADLVPSTLERLDQFLFSEDVQLADLSGAMRAISIHGPRAAAVVAQVVADMPASDPMDATTLAAWPDYHNARATFAGTPVVVARVDTLGVPGYTIYVAPEHEEPLRRALIDAGASEATAETVAAARLEAGYPLFGVDMDTTTIPLEAGIEGRAISLTKGCYVGQEVIIRVLHRGHGRVAKKLATLRVAGAPPAAGAKMFAQDREVGHVTSAAISPRFGAIALGYLHRDFLEPETKLEVESEGGRVAAVVSARPLAPAA